MLQPLNDLSTRLDANFVKWMEEVFSSIAALSFRPKIIGYILKNTRSKPHLRRPTPKPNFATISV